MQRDSAFKAVLFDLDGTLIEFKFPVRESRIAMFEFLTRNGYSTAGFKDTMRTQDLIDDAETQWKSSQEKQEKHSFSDLKQSLYRILDEFEYVSIVTSNPLSGTLETVQEINTEGLTCGVVTNTGRGPAVSTLSQIGFLPYLKIVVTRNEIARMKPAPDGLIEAQKLLHLEASSILYVGDSVLDIEASRSAGIKCAAIASGLYGTGVLEKASPDYMLQKIEDLNSILFANGSGC